MAVDLRQMSLHSLVEEGAYALYFIRNIYTRHCPRSKKATQEEISTEPCHHLASSLSIPE